MASEEEKREEAEKIFEEMSITAPRLAVNIPDGKESKSLDEVESDLGSPSDLVATLKRLFPKFSDIDINMVAQGVMVGRVSPDTMLDRIYLTTIAIAENHPIIHLEKRSEQEIRNIIKENLRKEPNEYNKTSASGCFNEVING